MNLWNKHPKIIILIKVIIKNLKNSYSNSILKIQIHQKEIMDSNSDKNRVYNLNKSENIKVTFYLLKEKGKQLSNNELLKMLDNYQEFTNEKNFDDWYGVNIQFEALSSERSINKFGYIRNLFIRKILYFVKGT